MVRLERTYKERCKEEKANTKCALLKFIKKAKTETTIKYGQNGMQHKSLYVRVMQNMTYFLTCLNFAQLVWGLLGSSGFFSA